jgi:O-antigen/teichoic acid export membrane protein
MTRDYVHTFSLEMVVLACQVLTYKLAADYWGSLGFSEYALARRALSLLHPGLMLGLAVALPRYAARASSRGPAAAAGYLYAGAGLVLVALILWAGFILSWDHRTAAVLFADESYASFMPPLALLLAGLSAHVVSYSYLRGTLRQRWANWLQLINVGLLPVLVFLLPDRSVPGLLTALGMAWILVAGPVLAALLMASRGTASVGEETRELVRFGVGRVPGEFVQMALFGVPAILVAHASGVELAGRVAFAMSVLSMVGSAFAPIGLVLLPRASVLAGRAALPELRQHVRGLAGFVVGAAALVTVVAEIATPAILRVYLGPGFHDSVVIVRLALVSSIPFALFMTLRSVIDAVHEVPLNTRNLLLAAGVFAASAPLLRTLLESPVAELVAVTLGFYVLGALTGRDAFRSLRAAA